MPPDEATTIAQSDHRCPDCGNALSRTPLGELCPRCALGLAADPPEQEGENIAELFPELVIEGQIARGGSGKVFRAAHKRLKRPVALKFLDPLLARSPQAVERFEREMAAVGTLDHPGIVRAHDAGERDGHWFIVMEFVEGEDLGQFSRRMGPLEPVLACRLVRESARALHYAHERGMVHRDVKPGNLMRVSTGDGVEHVAVSAVKVLDFGLAELIQMEVQAAAENADVPGDGEGSSRTASGFRGTLDYAAPETIETPDDVDVRADVFGLGATLYRLLTGRAPHSRGGDETLVSKMQRIAREPVTPVEVLRPDLPSDLAAAVGRLLAADRAERPANGYEVAELLTPFCGDPPSPALRRAPYLLTAAAALLATGAAAWFYFSKPPPAPEAPAPRTVVGFIDEFDDGELTKNSSGTGAGFRDAGQRALRENGGVIHMDDTLRQSSNHIPTMVAISGDPVFPFQESVPTTVVFKFRDIRLSPTWHRLWAGYSDAASTRDHFMPYAGRPPAQALYISIYSLDGGQSPFGDYGNLVAMNEKGLPTVLASWEWTDPARLSGLTLTLTTTRTGYALAFGGEGIGVKFISGAAAGPLRGLGVPTAEFRAGIHNQYDVRPGGVTVESVSLITGDTPLAAPGLPPDAKLPEPEPWTRVEPSDEDKSGVSPVPDRSGIVLEQPAGKVLSSVPVIVWGDVSDGKLKVPGGLTGARAIAAGGGHTVVLKSDGTVTAWGSNQHGQCAVPADLKGVRAVAAGLLHTLALKDDGTVTAWGYKDACQPVPPGLKDVTAISAGGFHSAALTKDGKVIVWGDNLNGQADVPPSLENVTAISAGADHMLALRSDGLITAWGRNDFGQCRVPDWVENITAISAGTESNAALRSDGTVVAWGRNDVGQTAPPPGLTGAAGIAASLGGHFMIARNDAGMLASWGLNNRGTTRFPNRLAGVEAIAAGTLHAAALLPSRVDFGRASAGAPVEKEFTLRNTGREPLTVSGIAVTDDPSAAFQVKAPALPAVCAPGKKLTFTVTGTATATAMLRVVSDDNDEGTFEVLLSSGTGG